MRGLGRYYELHVTCRGEPDATTGYFINIKHIDEAVREHVLPLFAQAIAQQPGSSVALGGLLRAGIGALQAPLGGHVHSLVLQLSPFLSMGLRSKDMDHVVMRQQYEFSAAHRLHVDELSDAENREVFGKCNNPAGHGHNYRVEVAVRVPIDRQGHVLTPQALDAIVDDAVIEPLDHKHLNVDVEAFRTVNPSVERIVKVVYDMLRPRIDGQVGTLEEVSVWETGKTVCTYRPA